MTKLDDMERLLAEATPGPWKIQEYNIPGSDIYSEGGMITGHHDEYGDPALKNEDAALIVAMRNTAPALIRLARAAKEFRDVYDSDDWQEYGPKRDEFEQALRELEN